MWSMDPHLFFLRGRFVNLVRKQRTCICDEATSVYRGRGEGEVGKKDDDDILSGYFGRTFGGGRTFRRVLQPLPVSSGVGRSGWILQCPDSRRLSCSSPCWCLHSVETKTRISMTQKCTTEGSELLCTNGTWLCRFTCSQLHVLSGISYMHWASSGIWDDENVPDNLWNNTERCAPV